VFQLTPATVASWTKRVDEQGHSALVQLPEPVSKFPDMDLTTVPTGAGFWCSWLPFACRSDSRSAAQRFPANVSRASNGARTGRRVALCETWALVAGSLAACCSHGHLLRALPSFADRDPQARGVIHCGRPGGQFRCARQLPEHSFRSIRQRADRSHGRCAQANTPSRQRSGPESRAKLVERALTMNSLDQDTHSICYDVRR